MESDLGNAFAEYMPETKSGNNNAGNITVNIYNPVVTDKQNIKDLAEQVNDELYKIQQRERRVLKSLLL